MRVAFVLNYPPAPAITGATLRSHALARALAGHAEVCAYVRAPATFLDGFGDHPDLAPFRTVEILPHDLASASAPNAQFRTSMDHWRDPSSPLWDGLRRAHKESPFSIVVCEQIFTVGAARALANVPWVLDEQNVESRVLERIAEPGGLITPEFHVPLAEAHGHEEVVWAAASLVTCVTDADAAEVKSRSGQSAVTMPNGVALSEISFVPPSRRASRDVLFVGSFFWPPNAEAALFLAHEVMPLVWRVVPDARLVLCGTAPPEKLRALAGPRVVVTGTVPSVRPFLRRARVYANALTNGGGAFLKTLEPLAAGIPLVSTGLGASGYGLQPGTHYVLADGAAAFARAIVDVLGEGAAGDARAECAREFISAYDWHRIGARFAEAVLRVAKGGCASPGKSANPMSSASEASPARLDRARVLFARGAGVSTSGETWTWLEEEVRRLGATTHHCEVSRGDAGGGELAKVAIRFAPSFLVSLGCDEATELAKKSGLPSLAVDSSASTTRETRLTALTTSLQKARIAVPTTALEGIPYVSREALIEELFVDGPEGVHTREDVSAYLDQALELGMPAAESDGYVTLNPNTTWNWLGERSAPFQERSRAYRRGRERGGLRPEARLRTSPRPVASGRQIERTHRIRVTFSVELDVDHLEPGTRYRAFLPFPIATETQSGVRLVDTAPAELAGSLAAEFGFVYGAEQRVADRATDVLRYRAELTAAELHVTIDEARRRPAPPVPTFEALRTHALSKTGDPVQRAFWVYDWMCNTGRVRRVSRPCSCPKCCAEQFDAAHEGDCILLAHAFVHYCAQLGVQAQAVRGALFEAPVGFDDRHYRARRLGQPVTCHTWAEFFDPTLGAIPVEFLGLAVGSADPSAYWDPELARADRVDRSFLREVYFGHIDNQRIAYSRSCLGVPCVLVHDMCMRRGRRWVPLDRHRMRFQHEVEVLSDGE